MASTFLASKFQRSDSIDPSILLTESLINVSPVVYDRFFRLLRSFATLPVLADSLEKDGKEERLIAALGKLQCTMQNVNFNLD